MGHKHSQEGILAAAVTTAFEDGLGNVTFGRVAKRLGISDRIVVYYFPTKDDLVGEVLRALGEQLQVALAPAFTEPADDHLGLAAAAWPVLARPDVDPIFALFFEASGLAAAGRAPFDGIVPPLVDAWIAWASLFITGPPSATPARSRGNHRPPRRPPPAPPAQRPEGRRPSRPQHRGPLIQRLRSALAVQHGHLRLGSALAGQVAGM